MKPEYLIPAWPAPPNVRALSTTRQEGSSAGAYRSLNLGDHVGDDPACVAANRAALVRDAALPAMPRWLRQVHGNQVIELRGQAMAAEADASWTTKPDEVCAILTADCLPVLFCDRAGSVVAAAHAGWRGLAAGVLEATIDALAVPPSALMAWLGPAISQDAFEVGAEVRGAFVDRVADAGACFVAGPAPGKYRADLYALARRALRRRGITEIHGGGHCTHGEPARFFSHRRDGRCGRMATLIWLE